jgi:predicted transcriptional regulator
MRPVGNLPDEWLFRDWCTNQVHTRTHRAALRSLGCNAGKRAPNGPSNCTHFASAPEKPKAPADLPLPPVVPSASSPAAQSSRRWQAGRRNYCLLTNGNMSIWAGADRQNALDHSIRSGPPGNRSDPVGCRKPITSGLSSSRQANSICPWAAFLQDNKACARMHRNCNAVEKQGCPMKTASIPSLRVAPALRQAAEEVLGESESLSNFVEQSIRESIERRLAQREFIARGLASRDKAKQSGKYVSSDAVVGRLEKMLAQAKASSKTSG